MNDRPEDIHTVIATVLCNRCLCTQTYINAYGSLDKFKCIHCQYLGYSAVEMLKPYNKLRDIPNGEVEECKICGTNTHRSGVCPKYL